MASVTPSVNANAPPPPFFPTDRPVGANAASTVADVSSAPVVRKSPAAGMTMAQLRDNYETIVRAGAIYYPVAYQLTSELGRGRQGIVFLGLRQGARGCITQHAIKLFDPGIYRTPEEYWTDMGRLASQISRLQSLQSPNLVPRHSYDETYGIGYSLMEAIDGMDLRRLLSGEPMEMARRNSTDEEWARFQRVLFNMRDGHLALQPGLAVYILRRMVRGIERLHSGNFLHSDVKPANAMVDRLGTIRIVDFGRAVTIGEKVTFLFGSPMYMAPEIHRREPGRVQSDLYSVGLVALEMLRGKPLADPDSTDEAGLLQVKMDLPRRLPELLPPSVQEEPALVRIIRRLVDTSPENRFASAKETDVGADGLIVVDSHFARKGFSVDTGRVLSEFMGKLVDPRTGRVDMPARGAKLAGGSERSQRVSGVPQPR